MSDIVLFTIAVSRPEKLEPLPGALAAAASMEAWAKEAEFVSYAITDDGLRDVTIERLNKAFIGCWTVPPQLWIVGRAEIEENIPSRTSYG